MKEIVCSGGEIALVDDEDYPLLSRHPWVYTSGQKKPYVVTTLNTMQGTQRTVTMHNMILGYRINIDHKNGDTLHNYKGNFREATWQENGWNCRKPKSSAGKPCTSRYKGVSYKPLKGKDRWLAYFKHVEHGQPKHTGKMVYIGYFYDEIEAAIAYNREIVKYRGEFAWVNPIPEINQDVRTKSS